MTAAERFFDVVEKGILSLTFILYPFAVYFGLQRFEPWVIYTGLGVVLAIRFAWSARRIDPDRIKQVIVPGMVVLGLVLVGGLLNDETFMFMLPGLISGVLCGFFLNSYFNPPSLIETFALMSVSDMTEKTRRYCRNVTLVWAGFMTLNTLVVIYLTFASLEKLWLWYTGVIAYVLMGLLFAVEFTYRIWKFRHYRGYWFDPFLRWMFPPRGNVKPTYIRFHKLMVQGRRNDFAVAANQNKTCTWRDLAEHVSGLRERMREHSSEQASSGRWMVFCQNAFSFCTGVLSTWQVDGVAVVPPGNREETITAILNEGVDGMISDVDGIRSNSNLPVLDPLAHTDQTFDFRIMDRDRTSLELFTSGSTGTRTAVPKNLGNIASELRTLEEEWSQTLDDCTMVATVSHQHIYGLLFKVLWPLIAGRTFFEDTVVYPDKIVRAVKQFADEGVCLVSTPAHLQRLVKYDAVDVIAPHVKHVFSSGGVLPEETAGALRDVFEHAPVEVFGSTETGGIAWRRRNGENPAWTPFDPAQTRIEDTLHVKSPFIHPDLAEEDGWFRTGDRCTARDRGFKFLGRADRDVNIADKRVSLEEVERALMKQEIVDEAKALSLERSSFNSTRRVIATVVLLEEDGKQLLELNSRKHVTKHLRDQLSQTLAPVAVPKLVRFVEQLPRDAQGKVTEKQLKSLFDNSHNESDDDETA